MIALLSLLAVALPQSPSDVFVRSDLRLPLKGVVLALQDADGDGDKDIIQIGPGGICVRLQAADGSFAAEPCEMLLWPTTKVAWDLEDIDNNGTTDVVLFEDGAVVRSYTLGANSVFGEGQIVHTAQGWLPPGTHRVNFARDVDGDGATDLVLPGQRSHRIYLATPEGSDEPFAAPLEVRYQADVNYELGRPDSLEGRFGRQVRVPWFELTDVDGDGTRDLISRTPEAVAFHLARPKLEAEPTWVLDLKGLAKSLTQQSGINLDDLLSNIDDRVLWTLADLDGKAPKDLVLGLGGKFQVYLGGSTKGPVGTPDQVLKSSGKVLAFFVRQVLGDDKPDLQILRGERISLSRALRYLILPGRLDFNVYTYVNDGGQFARRPTQRGTVGLEIPRLLSFAEDAEGISEAIDEQFEIPAIRFDWDGDGTRNDIIDVIEDQLRIVQNRAPLPGVVESVMSDTPDLDGILEAFVLSKLDNRGDGGELIFSLDQLADNDLAPGAILRSASRGIAPVAISPFGLVEQPTLRVVDLDGDGRDDVIGWGRKNHEWAIRLFVRKRSDR